MSISVNADDPATAVPFNLDQNSVNTNLNNGYIMGNPGRIGYLIDENGKINFPVLSVTRIQRFEKK